MINHNNIFYYGVILNKKQAAAKNIYENLRCRIKAWFYMREGAIRLKLMGIILLKVNINIIFLYIPQFIYS